MSVADAKLCVTVISKLNRRKKMDEKEFGILDEAQVEQFSSALKEMFEKIDELKIDFSSGEVSRAKLDDLLAPWCSWYSLPMSELVAVWAWSFQFDDDIRQIAKAKDPQKITLGFINAIDSVENLEQEVRMPFEFDGSASEKAQITDAYALSLCLAIIYNALCVGLYGVPIHDLLERAAEEEREKLLNAIIVDPTVISSGIGAHIFSKAVLNEDRSFLHEISKAITKTKPRPPFDRNRAVRYLLHSLYQSGREVSASRQDVRTLIVEKLGIYDEGKDPDSALQNLMLRLFQTWDT